MKSLLPAVLIICSTQSVGQDTLCLNVPFESSRVILFENNCFESTYASCTGVIYGEGTYTKTRRKIILNFDNAPDRVNTYSCYLDENEDSIRIQVVNQEDGSHLAYSRAYDGKTGFVSPTGFFTFTSASDSIQVKFLSASAVIYPQQEKCNVYTVWLTIGLVSYYEKSHIEIYRKKQQNKYIQKTRHQFENKHGKKRWQVYSKEWVFILGPESKQ